MSITMMRAFPLALLATAVTAGCKSTSRAGTDGITADGIKAHTTVLADDSLEGRGTGQRGYDRAVRYVADQFQKIGLEPGGTDGYLQSVPLRETKLGPAGAAVTISRGGKPTRLAPGDDFIASGDLRDTTSVLTGSIVFVGYGVSAPEFQYDDYAGIDVKGKVVAALWGAPPSLPPNPRAHYSGSGKAKVAADRGALGVITLWNEDADKALPWLFMQRLSRRSSMTWLDPAGGLPADDPELPSGAILSPKASAGLFEGSTKSWAAVTESARQSKPQAFPLPLTVRVEKTSEIRQLSAPNVIGRLPGSDPTLTSEQVVFTAHLDHDGISEAIDGDSIYNGALDNAAAVAALIEIARTFKRLPTPPKRTLLFIATAAEEKGLLGAAFYAAHPTVPIESIVANLNMDGNHLLFPTRSVIALGSEHSSLGEVAKTAATASDLELETELMPEQAFFIRSDQYPFVKKGVPALFFVNGTRSADSTVDGGAALGQWMATRYHTPKDDLSGPVHYESGAKYAQLVFRIGRIVADGAERPRWNPGDFFGEKFGRKDGDRPH